GSSQAVTNGKSINATTSANAGLSVGVTPSGSLGIPGVAGVGISTPMSVNTGGGGSLGVGLSHSETAGQSITSGIQSSEAVAHGTFKSHTDSVADTTSVADGTSQSHVDSLANTRSQGQATNEQWSQGLMRSQGWSQGSSRATTVSQAVSQTQTRSESQSHVVSQADSVAESASLSRGRSAGQGLVAAQNLMTSRGGGLGAGISPSISLSESWRLEDRVAMRVTQVLELQEQFLAEASVRGGWYGDTYLFCRTARGAAAAEAAMVQAFRGELAVTTFHTRRYEDVVADYLRLHGRTFVPSLRLETAPGAMERYRDANLWTQGQLAAITAPALLEGGRAVTVQTRMPPYSARPDHEGPVLLGQIINHETGETTGGLARLRRNQVSNTLIVADTGYGKSVLATWLEKEFHLRLGMRVVVLDFGFGHRTLLNLARPGRYEQYSLYVGGPRPIRWNVLQLPRRIAPEDALDRVTEIICLAGRMGPRQLAFLRRAWERLWMQAGVLSQGDNWDVPGKDGERLRDLDAEIQRRFHVEPGPGEPDIVAVRDPGQRQQLAIERSKRVDLHVLYTWLELYKNALPAAQNVDKTSLDGLLGRLRLLAFGELGQMYGRGEGSIAIEDLGWPDGVVVLEGGSMAAQTKAMVLGIASWIYYQDCVIRRVQGGPDSRIPLVLTIEEANKVLGAADFTKRADDPLGTGDNIFDQMIRDARKYLIYMLIVGQTPSVMSTGILGSCNTVFSGRLKMGADRDVMVPMWGKVEKGFVNVEYLEHLSTLPIAQFVSSLGVTTDRAELEPRLLHTFLPGAVEPSNEEVERYFATYGLPPALS
ncbi:MAG: hypothetical protein KKB13_13770, partial [Chloroflexi bacterium]|nr:hypothetical protein [Chloroflexota bacterium]